MTERKFTDNEVISALQCVSGEDIPCRGCPFLNIPFPTCKELAAKQALDLIRRQRAEIERLQEYYKRYYDLTRETKELQDVVEHAKDRLSLFDEAITTERAEAIKEFAEKMKKRECRNAYCYFCAHATIYGERAKECDEPYIDKDGKEHSQCFMFSKFESYIDKLVKEKTEGKQ